MVHLSNKNMEQKERSAARLLRCAGSRLGPGFLRSFVNGVRVASPASRDLGGQILAVPDLGTGELLLGSSVNPGVETGIAAKVVADFGLVRVEVRFCLTGYGVQLLLAWVRHVFYRVICVFAECSAASCDGNTRGVKIMLDRFARSEERRVGKECRN